MVNEFFVVGFYLLGHGNIGEHRFNDLVTACRFVEKVEKRVSRDGDFGYLVQHYRGRNLVRKIGAPGIPGKTCRDILRPIKEKEEREHLQQRLDTIYDSFERRPHGACWSNYTEDCW